MTHPTPGRLPGVNADVPSPARIYDFLLLGKTNFEADRRVAEMAISFTPEVRTIALANRQFLIAATRYLAEQGISQYLDIGSGLPTQENVHEVVRGINPRATTVYVDNDPSVLPMAQALIVGEPNTHYIQADLRDPQSILSNPEVLRRLDLSQPMGLLMVAVLHFVDDSYDPYGLIGRFVDALPSGSYLAFSHVSSTDADPDLYKVLQAQNNQLAVPIQYRSRDEINKFLDQTGLEVVEPGLVDVDAWAPGKELGRDPSRVHVYGAVARKK